MCSSKRADVELAAIIEEGRRIDAEKGAANAWAYLLAHAIDPPTILRVLSGSAVRRADGAGDARDGS